MPEKEKCKNTTLSTNTENEHEIGINYGAVRRAALDNHQHTLYDNVFRLRNAPIYNPTMVVKSQFMDNFMRDVGLIYNE